MKMRYFIIFSIISCWCYLLAETKNNFHQIWKPFVIKGFVYDILTTLLKRCNLNMRKIIIYDEYYFLETSLVIAEIQPRTSVTIMRNPGAWRSKSQYRFDDIEIDAVILVIDMRDDPWPDLLRVFLRWRFKRNSTIYIIPKQLEFCLSYKQTFLYVMRFYFPAAYYICIKDRRYPVIYTQDPYGDTGPLHWVKTNQNLMYGKNWTFYGRVIRNQGLTDFCPGFNFNRTDPNHQNLTIGIPYIQTIPGWGRRREGIYGEEFEERIIPPLRRKLEYFKKLLKIQFSYVTLEYNPLQPDFPQRAYDLTSVDTLLLTKYVVNSLIWWHYFYPTEYEPYGIISHNRGFMTPLEKIAKYYGIWTLLSLCIMLTITFIVVWASTRRIDIASFDVIRLLIEAEIIVPINTPARKIFFSMVFLYFLIIHATFSGHLAEFLTSVDRRLNVETLEDLKDVKINQIFYFGYKFDADSSILRRKLSSLDNSYDCEKVIKHEGYTCIAPLPALEETRLKVKDKNNSLYISKKRIGLSLISSLYRQGFPLAEKINWATVFMFDTSIINEKVKANRESLAILDKIHGARITINYRSITVNDIYFALIFSITGNCIGILCFFFELSLMAIRKKVTFNIIRRPGIFLKIKM